MNRFVLGCGGIALAFGLVACDTNFKATDKLMRNEHRVVQNTRVFQQPDVVVQQPQQVQPIVQRVVEPVVQQIVEPVTPKVEKKIVTRTVTPEPIYKTVYIDAPVQTKVIQNTVVGQRINISTLSRIQITSLQRALASRGFYKAPVDGIFGIRTAQALATYQRDAGVSGPVTRQVLEDLGLII